jgi:hypothetical protein
LEIEYEQLIIRANNDERRNNSEYFVLDRQYALQRFRIDLIGIYWGWKGRKSYQEVPLCLMEIKFALNSDIQTVHSQLEGYYDLIKNRVPELAYEYQTMLQQKCELGLFNQPQDRLSALRTLKISPDIKRMRFIVILVDYNPYSRHFDASKLKNLHFASQVWLFRTGFGMWDTSPALGVTPIG